jgi:hypothetical protein
MCEKPDTRNLVISAREFTFYEVSGPPTLIEVVKTEHTSEVVDEGFVVASLVLEYLGSYTTRIYTPYRTNDGKKSRRLIVDESFREFSNIDLAVKWIYEWHEWQVSDEVLKQIVAQLMPYVPHRFDPAKIAKLQGETIFLGHKQPEIPAEGEVKLSTSPLFIRREYCCACGCLLCQKQHFDYINPRVENGASDTLELPYHVHYNYVNKHGLRGSDQICIHCLLSVLESYFGETYSEMWSFPSKDELNDMITKTTDGFPSGMTATRNISASWLPAHLMMALVIYCEEWGRNVYPYQF